MALPRRLDHRARAACRRWPESAAGAGLVAILVSYVWLASQFARLTPLWQAPDEPAHFNYVARVAATPLDPPEIEDGDYPFAYLEMLKALRFPPGRPIHALTYEDHQPPLYYYLAAAAYRLADEKIASRLRSVRLVSVLFGGFLVCLGWWFAHRSWPGPAWLPLATAGFVAFLPMQLAGTAAANNDALANVVAAAALCWALERGAHGAGGRWGAALSGVLLGVALLTKLTIVAPAAALVASGEIVAWRRHRTSQSSPLRTVSTAALAAGMVSSPWLVRNARLYGLADLLALQRHDSVVLGQPRTGDWIASHGVGAWLQRLVVFTFDSFWGVFGWMGEFLDGRVYRGLALVTLIAGLGLVAGAWQARRGARTLTDRERLTFGLCGVAIVAVGVAFLGYNVRLVQHQGRYFFGALVPIAFLFALGLGQVGRGLSLLLAHLPPASSAGRRLDCLAASLPLGFVILLAILSWISLHAYIVPHLAPPP